MGYIMDLRKIVGHRKLLMAGAGVFILRDGQILLQRRRDNGLWADHGGSVELSERVEDTARRELTEETGLTAGRLEFLGLLSGPEMDYTYPNGDEVSMLCVYYLCRDFSGEIRRQQEEVTELRWFPLDALPGKAEWNPVSWQALQLLLDYLKKETDGFPPNRIGMKFSKALPFISGKVRPQLVKKAASNPWGCMKGPQPLHLQSAGAGLPPRGEVRMTSTSIIFRP